MTALSRNILAASLTVSLAVGLAACHKKVPPPPRRRLRRRTGDATTAAPATAASGSNAAGAADGRSALRAQDASTSSTRRSRCRRVLRSRQVRLEGSGARGAAEGRRVAKRWPTHEITVEGHCDSRGTAEYNLGARRAPRVGGAATTW